VAHSSVAAGVFGVLGVIAVFAGYYVFAAGLIAWTSSVWTVLWRRLANRDADTPELTVPVGADAEARA